jgi:ABC-type sugar transport system substrate-binding protein
MTTTSTGRRPRKLGAAQLRSLLKPAALAAAAVLLAACSSTTAPSGGSAAAGPSVEPVNAGSADQAAVAATIKKAFLTDVPTTQLDPVVVNAMAVAATPLTAEQNTLLATCLQKAVCETGRGSLTIAFPNDNVNTWRSTFRAELTAQAIASPQIKKIVYNNAADVATEIANMKSLIAQRVDIIVMDTIYASAILPTVKEAKAAGITVIEAQAPIPDELAAEVDSTIAPDLCQLYTDAAKQVAATGGSGSSYAIYTGIAGGSTAAVWQPCFRQTMKAAGWTEATEGFTQWSPQVEKQAANALLASGKKPDAIIYDASPEEFLKPYISDKSKPPVVMSDVVYQSWLTTYKDGVDAGIKPSGIVSNSQVWYGRLGVTAGVMVKAGQPVAKKIVPPGPSVSVDDVLSRNDPSLPEAAPVPTLLTPEQMKLALSVS